jgi:hypothetical protein
MMTENSTNPPGRSPSLAETDLRVDDATHIQIGLLAESRNQWKNDLPRRSNPTIPSPSKNPLAAGRFVLEQRANHFSRPPTSREGDGAGQIKGRILQMCARLNF